MTTQQDVDRANERLSKAWALLDLNSDNVYQTIGGTFAFTADPLQAQRMREFFSTARPNYISISISGHYVPEQSCEEYELRLRTRGVFRLTEGVITSACMLIEPLSSDYSIAHKWLSSWHEEGVEMPASAEELSAELDRVAEETRIQEQQWQEERTKRRLKEEAFWAYREKFCAKFGLQEDREVAKIRADKKARSIMQHLGFEPTTEDLRSGKILSKIIDEHGNALHVAFVKTRRGGLVCGVSLTEDSYRLERWAGDTSYAENRTDEEKAEEQKYRQMRQDSKLEKAELDKMFTESLHQPHVREIKPQAPSVKAKEPAKPEAFSKIIDTLVTRAVSDTNEPRESHPDRRPTWGPPIPFSQELIDSLNQLKVFCPKLDYDPRYGRLWAVWQNPKSTAPGHCRGFELCAGRTREADNVIAKIRPGYGAWWIGPDWTPPYYRYVKPLDEREATVRELLTRCYKDDPEKIERLLPERLQQAKADFEREEREMLKTMEKRQRQYELYTLRISLRSLGASAILAFAGAPDEIMQAGARLAGICCRCGRELTDPTSMALGVGPECIKTVKKIFPALHPSELAEAYKEMQRQLARG